MSVILINWFCAKKVSWQMPDGVPLRCSAFPVVHWLVHLVFSGSHRSREAEKLDKVRIMNDC